jgi:hypothetical protein
MVKTEIKNLFEYLRNKRPDHIEFLKKQNLWTLLQVSYFASIPIAGSELCEFPTQYNLGKKEQAIKGTFFVTRMVVEQEKLIILIKKLSTYNRLRKKTFILPYLMKTIIYNSDKLRNMCTSLLCDLNLGTIHQFNDFVKNRLQ